MIPIGLVMLLSPFASVQEVGEYRAKNVAASYLVERLNPKPPPTQPLSRQSGQGLIPDDLKVSFDASTNMVKLAGKAEDIAAVKRYLQMFDVAPWRLDLHVEGELPLFSYRYSNPISVSNNGKWTLDEPSRGFFVSIVARLNDDGYATMFIEHRFNEVSIKTTARAKIGETVYLDQKGQPSTSARIFEGPPGDAPPFRFRLTFKATQRPDTESNKSRLSL